jgi:hypothetical protein
MIDGLDAERARAEDWFLVFRCRQPTELVKGAALGRQHVLLGVDLFGVRAPAEPVLD